MTEGLKGWLLSLIAAALLVSLALALTSKGGTRKAVCLCGGLLLALICLGPLSKIDGESLAQTLSRLEMEAETARTGIQIRNRELTAAIIKQNCETYILDKAASMGLKLSVELEMAGENTYPYPSSVTLTGTATEEQRSELSDFLEERFAIPKEKQLWK